MKIKKALKHIKSISTPFGGLSWDISTTEREVIRKLIIFLEDRAVLFNPYQLEDLRWVIKSISEIRQYLTETLQKLDETTPLIYYLKAMRASCRKFMNNTKDCKFGGMIEKAETFASLGEVRAMFGFYLKDLVSKFNIDIEEGLMSIFPAEDK